MKPVKVSPVLAADVAATNNDVCDIVVISVFSQSSMTAIVVFC